VFSVRRHLCCTDVNDGRFFRQFHLPVVHLQEEHRRGLRQLVADQLSQTLDQILLVRRAQTVELAQEVLVQRVVVYVHFSAMPTRPDEMIIHGKRLEKSQFRSHENALKEIIFLR